MNCSFCFNAGITKSDDITVEVFRRLAGILAHAGVREIDILGGEPTLHSSIEEIVRAACGEGLAVSLSSNGSRVPVMMELLDAFGDSCSLGVSLNGAEIDSPLDAFLTVHKPLVKSLYRETAGSNESISAILSKGIRKYYLIYPDIIAGNRKHSIPFQQFHHAIETLRKSVPNTEPVYCSGFLPDAATYPGLLAARCSAGVTKLGILPDGSVFPCNLFFGMEEFYLGNILHDRFELIWNSPKLHFFRGFAKNRCPVSHCRLHAECHGGCPAHSVKYYGSLNGPDPRCAQLPLSLPLR